MTEKFYEAVTVVELLPPVRVYWCNGLTGRLKRRAKLRFVHKPHRLRDDQWKLWDDIPNRVQLGGSEKLVRWQYCEYSKTLFWYWVYLAKEVR